MQASDPAIVSGAGLSYENCLMPTIAVRPEHAAGADLFRHSIRREGRLAARCAMAIEIRVPTLGESISEATVGKWFKKAGEPVRADEPLVELETDKVTLEVNAPGRRRAERDHRGDRRDGRDRRAARPGRRGGRGRGCKPAAPRRAAQAPRLRPQPHRATAMPPAPSAAKIAAENKIDLDCVAGSGKRGQVLKGDVLAAVDAGGSAPAPAVAPFRRLRLRPFPRPRRARPPPDDGAREERVRMTKLRQTIARRLKDAQNTAAMLTTFNEVDMSEVMALRARYKDAFEKKHGGQARLHGLLREGLRAGAEGDPGRQRRDRRRRPRLQELLPPRHRGRHRQGPHRAGGARLRQAFDRRRSRSRSPISASARATAS